MQENYEIFKNLIQTVGLLYYRSFTVYSGHITQGYKPRISIFLNELRDWAGK